MSDENAKDQKAGGFGETIWGWVNTIFGYVKSFIPGLADTNLADNKSSIMGMVESFIAPMLPEFLAKSIFPDYKPQEKPLTAKERKDNAEAEMAEMQKEAMKKQQAGGTVTPAASPPQTSGVTDTTLPVRGQFKDSAGTAAPAAPAPAAGTAANNVPTAGPS